MTKDASTTRTSNITIRSRNHNILRKWILHINASNDVATMLITLQRLVWDTLGTAASSWFCNYRCRKTCSDRLSDHITFLAITFLPSSNSISNDIKKQHGESQLPSYVYSRFSLQWYTVPWRIGDSQLPAILHRWSSTQFAPISMDTCILVLANPYCIPNTRASMALANPHLQDIALSNRLSY